MPRSGGHLDQEQPGVNDAPDQAGQDGRDHPVQAAARLGPAPDWGATSTMAAIAEVMNRTRVWAAREARLRDRASVSLLIDTATNSRPVSAPARPATVTPKSRHIPGR